MGMYDDLMFEGSLPDTSQEELDDMEECFQTKSLESNLDVITIKRDGELFINEKFNDYTGHIVFYTSGKTYKVLPTDYPRLNTTYNKYTWYEYDALFVFGKLHSIKRIEEEEETINV